MNAILLQRTEPTTDSPDAGPLTGPTSNHADAGFLLFSRVTPSGEIELDAEQFTSDHVLLRLFGDTAADHAPPPVEYIRIDDLGEAGYHVLQPIAVEIRRVGIGDYEASFREANIAMSGDDLNDAFQALVVEILETLDVLLREQNLGPDAADQRRILDTYIVRA